MEIINQSEEVNVPEVCFLCGGDHHISSCEDEELIDFEQNIVIFYHTINDNGEFTEFLNENIVNLDFMFHLKCLAMKRCGCDRNTSIITVMKEFKRYIITNYTNGHSEPFVEEEINSQEIYRAIVERLSLTPNEDPPPPPAEKIKLNVEIEVNNYEEDHAKNLFCSICLNESDIRNFVNFKCLHEFCKDCTLSILNKKNNTDTFSCSLCRQNVDYIKFHSDKTYEELKHFCIK
jgi:hypothetical protein